MQEERDDHVKMVGQFGSGGQRKREDRSGCRTLRKVAQKYLESFEICCRMENISWTDRVRNEKSM